MKRLFLLAAVVAALSFIGSPAAKAQSQAMIGPKVGLWIEAGRFALGGIVDVFLTPNVSIEPGVQIVFIPDITTLVFDGNVKYSFPLRGETFSPYINGGLGLWYQSWSFGNSSYSDTFFRLNLGGGVTFDVRSNIQWFTGLNIAFANGSDVMIYGGAKFAL